MIVCNRRGESQRGNKGDRSDAEQLADLLRHGALRAVYHDSGQRAALNYAEGPSAAASASAARYL